jgi:DNA-binding PadR family transcriptional regulator
MASPDTTRMLVLGVAQTFEPANGYQLRRELLSWQVDEWANVNPGSIYSMLTTLSKQGMLDRTDLVMREGARPVAVYRTTPGGREELKSLVRRGLTEAVPFDQTSFYAALSLMAALLPRDEVIELLETRLIALRRSTKRNSETITQLDEARQAPPHVARLFEFSVALLRAEAEWLEAFVVSLRAGAMLFAGDDWSEGWEPAKDDPAWGMVRERARYLKALGAEQ